ncbi:hypothetical protein CEUSTIGMA_g10362.t1 [Chlamydomonas eustigma]|uniref:Uncharacterized protein n=1 Tax=Chlamydomonas eustigma TaxID=1157962 RepID=A0A250XIN2_9CHLO|nr:hypothetical protein CEUSTIGMA_g10362.t1 [Chlamydomonas eustigma]|eukprot:GAX82935.1 hypothetical protein CEUSTIGMA_g10362.t1 [Chlamydomonas eustigma]
MPGNTPFRTYIKAPKNVTITVVGPPKLLDEPLTIFSGRGYEDMGNVSLPTEGVTNLSFTWTVPPGNDDMSAAVEMHEYFSVANNSLPQLDTPPPAPPGTVCPCPPIPINNTCPEGTTLAITSLASNASVYTLQCLAAPQYDELREVFEFSTCFQWSCLPPAFKGEAYYIGVPNITQYNINKMPSGEYRLVAVQLPTSGITSFDILLYIPDLPWLDGESVAVQMWLESTPPVPPPPPVLPPLPPALPVTIITPNTTVLVAEFVVLENILDQAALDAMLLRDSTAITANLTAYLLMLYPQFTDYLSIPDCLPHSQSAFLTALATVLGLPNSSFRVTACSYVYHGDPKTDGSRRRSVRQTLTPSLSNEHAPHLPAAIAADEYAGLEWPDNQLDLEDVLLDQDLGGSGVQGLFVLENSSVLNDSGLFGPALGRSVLQQGGGGGLMQQFQDPCQRPWINLEVGVTLTPQLLTQFGSLENLTAATSTVMTSYYGPERLCLRPSVLNTLVQVRKVLYGQELGMQEPSPDPAGTANISRSRALIETGTPEIAAAAAVPGGDSVSRSSDLALQCDGLVAMIQRPEDKKVDPYCFTTSYQSLYGWSIPSSTSPASSKVPEQSRAVQQPPVVLSSGGGVQVGIIAAVVVSVLVALAMLTGAVVFMIVVRRRRRLKVQPEVQQQQQPDAVSDPDAQLQEELQEEDVEMYAVPLPDASNQQGESPRTQALRSQLGQVNGVLTDAISALNSKRASRASRAASTGASNSIPIQVLRGHFTSDGMVYSMDVKPTCSQSAAAAAPDDLAAAAIELIRRDRSTFIPEAPRPASLGSSPSSGRSSVASLQSSRFHTHPYLGGRLIDKPSYTPSMVPNASFYLEDSTEAALRASGVLMRKVGEGGDYCSTPSSSSSSSSSSPSAGTLRRRRKRGSKSSSNSTPSVACSDGRYGKNTDDGVGVMVSTSSPEACGVGGIEADLEVSHRSISAWLPLPMDQLRRLRTKSRTFMENPLADPHEASGTSPALHAEDGAIHGGVPHRVGSPMHFPSQLPAASQALSNKDGVFSNPAFSPLVDNPAYFPLEAAAAAAAGEGSPDLHANPTFRQLELAGPSGEADVTATSVLSYSRARTMTSVVRHGLLYLPARSRFSRSAYQDRESNITSSMVPEVEGKYPLFPPAPVVSATQDASALRISGRGSLGDVV